MTKTEEMNDLLKSHGITVRAEFVPFSVSRNAKPVKTISDLSINWKVTVARAGRDILTTDYSEGVGHCPAHKADAAKLAPGLFADAAKLKAEGNPAADKRFAAARKLAEQRRFEAAKRECEEGRTKWRMLLDNSPWCEIYTSQGCQTPEPADVLYCLISDASVLDTSGFEEWAGELGYDTDSRAAEKIYRECLELALKLRAGLGERLLSELREAFQDY